MPQNFTAAAETDHNALLSLRESRLAVARENGERDTIGNTVHACLVCCLKFTEPSNFWTGE